MRGLAGGTEGKVLEPGEGGWIPVLSAISPESGRRSSRRDPPGREARGRAPERFSLILHELFPLPLPSLSLSQGGLQGLSHPFSLSAVMLQRWERPSLTSFS